jgi:hypothetical protein
VNLARYLRNATPFAAQAVLLETREGREVLTLIAKMTWEVPAGAEPRIAVPRAPIHVEPEPARPGSATSSLRRPSDHWAEKPGTDVLLVGTAHPARGGLKTHDVSLRVASASGLLDKTVRVTGPRVWMKGLTGITPGPSGPVEPTALEWENAYGGADLEGAEPLVDMRNPAGSGGVPRAREARRSTGAGARRSCGAGGLTRAHPRLLRPHRARLAAGRAARWHLRRDVAARAGSPAPQPTRAPRFASAAPAGQWLASRLVGDEPIEVLGATPDGALRFKLPRYAPRARVVERGVVTELALELDTLLVDTDTRTVELTFRAHVPAPLRLGFLDEITLSAAHTLPDWMLPDWGARLDAYEEQRGVG